MGFKVSRQGDTSQHTNRMGRRVPLSQKDLKAQDVPRTSNVALYLLPDDDKRLYRYNSGTRFVAIRAYRRQLEK
jgi:hypothetical protein